MNSDTPPINTGTVPKTYDASYFERTLQSMQRTINQLLSVGVTRSSTANLSTLPTSASGLRAGDLWNDNSVVRVAPSTTTSFQPLDADLTTIANNTTPNWLWGTTTGGATTLVTYKPSYYNIRDYGAIPNDSTDNTAAIQAAMDATPAGGTLYIPYGIYLIRGSGTAILTRTAGQGTINIVGDGNWSVLAVASDVPDTRDIIRFTYSTNDGTRGGILRDFRISAEGSATGRHGIFFDLSDAASPTLTLYQWIVYNVSYQTPSATGYSFYVKGQASNTNGAWRDSMLFSCIFSSAKFEIVGDNNMLLHSIFGDDYSGFHPAITVSNQSGCVGFLIDHCIMSSVGGSLIYEGGSPGSIIFRDNEIEFPSGGTSSSPNGAMIDVTCDLHPCQNIIIEGNGISNGGGDNPIRIGADADYTKIESNRFNVEVGVSAIEIVAGATGTIIGGLNTVIEAGTPIATRDSVTDAGTSTDYVITEADFAVQTWVPTVTSTGGAITSYTINFAEYVKIDRLVQAFWSFTITDNGTGSGEIVMTLPYAAHMDGAPAANMNDSGAVVPFYGYAVTGTSNLHIFKMDNTYPGSTGRVIQGQITYLTA